MDKAFQAWRPYPSYLTIRNRALFNLTSLALVIHEYQCNELNSMGVVSKIPSDDSVRQVILNFIVRVKEDITHSEEYQCFGKPASWDYSLFIYLLAIKSMVLIKSLLNALLTFSFELSIISFPVSFIS